jgi:membrane-associated phospholipid phosphatase
VFTSPARWKEKDWITFAALAATGTALIAFDGRVYGWVQDRKSRFTEDLSPYISKLGKGTYLAALTAALYASGEIFNGPGLRRTALLSVESFLTTSAIVLTLKVVAGRARPYTGESPGSFYPFSFFSRHTSFPSGDAAGAFAVATVIADRTDSVFVDVLSYGLAGLVALYRVHDTQHWPSDVFAGSALGFYVGKKISGLNKDQGVAKYHLAFQFTPRLQCLTLAVAF